MKKGEIFISGFDEFISGKSNKFQLFELVEIGKEETDTTALFGTRRLLKFENIDTNEIVYFFDNECYTFLEKFTSSIENRLMSEYNKLQERINSIVSTGINFS